MKSNEVTMKDVESAVEYLNERLARYGFTLRYGLVIESDACYLFDTVSGGTVGRCMDAHGMLDTLGVISQSLPKFKPTFQSKPQEAEA